MAFLTNIKNKTPLGIYVHVPFCRSKCQYCDFYSLCTKEDKIIDGYLDAVCDHIKEAGELAPGYKVDTIFIVGAYRPRSRGFGSTALKSLLEGHKDYAIGTVSGRSVHALNLTGDLIENAYRPCLELDNGTVYVLPRTAVTAPRNEKKH